MKSYHPRHIHHHFLRNLHIPTALCAALIVASVLSVGAFVFASTTINFRMVINPGTLSIGMVDGNFVPLIDPAITMQPKLQSNICQSSVGILGTFAAQIYVKNPDAADGGWVATLSTASPEAKWQWDAYSFDFNDPTSSGCIDGDDADVVGGQMRVDMSASHIHLGTCLASCSWLDVVRWSSAAFHEWMIDTIALLSASSGSSDLGDWVLHDIAVTQTIPANQWISENYYLDLYLSITSV